jgi:glycosyltransferase involved in cell wall biosynthesis
MLGPGLEVRGGVSAVERTLIENLPAEIAVTHVATMAEGTKAYKLLKFVQAAARTLERLELDTQLVHLHFSSGASSVRKTILARLALGRGLKVVMHAHGGGYRDYLDRAPARTRRATLDTLRRVDCLIVLGETWRELFVANGVPPDRVVVVPNPVALPAAPPARPSHTPVRFVYLGLVAPKKGTFDLVQAVAGLAPELRARVEVVIAGNGETARLGSLVRQHDLGRTIEVRDWLDSESRDRLLESADVLVLPSYAEGLPLSVLEGMAWGLPPICTPVGSVPEWVRHEDNGLLVQPGDVGQLTAAIRRLATDDEERRRLAERARAAVEPLAANRCAEKVASIYRSVARGEALP